MQKVNGKKAVVPPNETDTLLAKRKRAPEPLPRGRAVSLDMARVSARAEEPSNLADVQPLRRTRSLARKVEKLGVPVSSLQGTSSSMSRSNSNSTIKSLSARGRSQLDVQPEEEEDVESETDSVEQSIANMSLDEIRETEDSESGASVDETGKASTRVWICSGC